MTKLKENIQSILHPERKGIWHPPRAPIVIPVSRESIVSEILHGSDHDMKRANGFEGLSPLPMVTNKSDDSKLAIDFDDEYYLKLSKSSEFRRLEYLVRTGKTHRGTLKQLDKDLQEFHKDINMFQKLRSLPPDLLKELKEKIKDRRIE